MASAEESADGPKIDGRERSLGGEERLQLKICSFLGRHSIFMKRMCMYSEMKRELRKLSKNYPNLVRGFRLTDTADGKRIYGMCVGEKWAKYHIVIQAAMHAREWLNTELLLKQIRYICQNYDRGILEGKTYREWLQPVCFWVLPMVNPDGVGISQTGVRSLRCAKLQKNLCTVDGLMTKRRWKYWKANARGVDLNRNYDVGFATDTASQAGIENYAGKTPFSERETRALVKLIRTVKPVAVINYHETGHVIYYQKSEELAKRLRQMTGYRLCREWGEPNGNLGDWLTKEGIDWCTLETCVGKAPVRRWQLAAEWYRHRNLFLVIAKFYQEV